MAAEIAEKQKKWWDFSAVSAASAFPVPGCDVRSTAMPLNHYVTLGRSGLRVSPFCLGAMTFGEDWGWGSSVAEYRGDHRALPRARRQLHRYRQRLHQGALREDHRRFHRSRRAPAAIAWSSPPSSSATSTKAIPTAAAPAARRSSRPARSRCGGCRPTTSTSTGCTAGTSSRRSTRRCARSTIWCARARFATSASPTRRRGRWRRRRRSRSSAAGRRWSRCRSSTR